MLKRFLDILLYINEALDEGLIDITKVAKLSLSTKDVQVDLMLTKNEIVKIEKLVNNMKALHEVTETLQNHDQSKMNWLKARNIFSGVMEDYPIMTQYLSPDADIVHSPHFEKAIVKVMKGNIDSLDEFEEQSIKKFKIDTNQTISTTKSYIEKEIEMLYVCLAWIPCTSNACERLFSRCNIIFDSFRQSMLPINMEILLYLKS